MLILTSSSLCYESLYCGFDALYFPVNLYTRVVAPLGCAFDAFFLPKKN